MSCKVRGHKFRDHDDAHDFFVERDMLEADEALAAKRQAARFSPEEMSLQEARIEGAKAGRRGTAAALNPYQHTEPEHAEWEKHRMQALARAVA